MMTLHEVSALGTLLRWVLRHPEGEAPAPARALRAAMFLAERAAKADPLFLSPQLIRRRWHRARPNPERPRCSWCGADGDRVAVLLTAWQDPNVWICGGCMAALGETARCVDVNEPRRENREQLD